MRQRLRDLHNEVVPHVDSAGTESYHVGQPPDARAVRVARQNGIDMSGQRARQIQLDDLNHFDLVLCADQVNLDALQTRFGDQGSARRDLLLPYVGIDEPRHVPDPYYGDLRDFESVFALLSRAADALSVRLS